MTKRRGLVGETWFPLRERAEGERRSYRGVLQVVAEVERFANCGDELEEARLLACRRRARLREVDRDHVRDPPGARRHHDDARREEDGLSYRVRDEHDRRTARLPDLQQLHVQSL